MGSQMSVRYSEYVEKDLQVDATISRETQIGLFDSLYRNVAKRVFDVLFVLLAIPIVLPILVVLAVVIMCRGGNPIYRQERIGRGGKHFTMWKLRTMVVDADSLLKEHLDTNDLARREWQKTQKLRNDPRITRFGTFLRKSSLDELPQLWNVLRGDMSLVGPRPMLPEQRSIYPGKDYYALRPGITGPWQISERNDSSFADRAKFDASYNKTLSPRSDFVLLVGTIGVVLRGTGC